MKSEVVLCEPKNENSRVISSYPYLGRSRLNGWIVLFYNYRQGTIVATPDREDLHRVGFYHEGFNAEVFDPLPANESVVIQNLVSRG